MQAHGCALLLCKNCRIQHRYKDNSCHTKKYTDVFFFNTTRKHTDVRSYFARIAAHKIATKTILATQKNTRMYFFV